MGCLKLEKYHDQKPLKVVYSKAKNQSLGRGDNEVGLIVAGLNHALHSFVDPPGDGEASSESEDKVYDGGTLDEVIIKTKAQLANINTGLQVADGVGVGSAMGKQLALDYRSSRPLMSRVGMSGNARTISGLGTASKWLGRAGYGAVGLGTYLDINAYNSGQISGARFTYNTLGTGASFGAGLVNPIAGGVVGGSFWIGQQFYDGYMYWANQMSAGINNFNNWISNPARY